MSLTHQQRLFALEYALGEDAGNATKAAERAGYSAKTAKQQGSRLLTNADVRALVDRHLEKRAKKLELNAERLDLELARLAYADAGELEDPATGTLYGSIRAIPEDTRRAVHKVKVRIAKVVRGPKAAGAAAALGVAAEDGEGRKVEEVALGTVEVSLHDKNAAIAQANKVLGRLKDKIEVIAKLSHEQLLVLAAKVREQKLAARAGAVGGTPAAPVGGQR